MDYLLERLQKLDKQINDAEKALTHLNKQVGAKMQKLSRLKNERSKVSEEYRSFVGNENNVSDRPQNITE
jgi:chromosome segregation ATPase